MTTETILTDEEIIVLGKQASGIESGENGYILPIAFARAIEQAVLQSLPVQTSSTIRGDSYAGVYIWLGSHNILHHIPKISAEKARYPKSMIEGVAYECVKQLEQAVLQSTKVQEWKRDAERYRWLKKQFRIMSLDMGGNHTWVLQRPLREGCSIDAVCDASMEK